MSEGRVFWTGLLGRGRPSTSANREGSRLPALPLSRARFQRRLSHEARPPELHGGRPGPTTPPGRVECRAGCITSSSSTQRTHTLPSHHRAGGPDDCSRPRRRPRCPSTPRRHRGPRGEGGLRPVPVGLCIVATELITPARGASVLGDTSSPHMAYAGARAQTRTDGCLSGSETQPWGLPKRWTICEPRSRGPRVRRSHTGFLISLSYPAPLLRRQAA